MNLYTKSILIWFLIAFAETIHGIIRARFIAPKVGDLRSRQIGTITGSILIYFICYHSLNWIKPNNIYDSFIVGLIWFLLMTMFEFLVGRYLFHFSWKWLLDEYNVKKGRILIFGMLFLLFVPTIIFLNNN